MKLEKGQKIGSYTVESEIKRGGMAVVLQVRAPSGQIFAMKLSLVGYSAERDDQNRHAIRGEADLLSQFRHLRIVRVFPIPRDGLEKAGVKYYANAYHLEGRPWYFIMEYLAGGSLAEHLRKHGAITVAEATNIVGNICLGLYTLHVRGITHNDVKAENVVFRTPLRRGESFDPVLIDFGTAAGVKRYTEEAGTPYTMSPERIRVARGLDAPEGALRIDAVKAEIWAVGVLLYQALSQRPPFPARNVKTLTSQIVNDTPASLQSFNKDVDNQLDRFVIDYCLCKDPYYRPNIQDVLKFLKPYGGGGVAAVTVSN